MMTDQITLKEAILIRKMENDRRLKSRWDINRNLPIGNAKHKAGRLILTLQTEYHLYGKKSVQGWSSDSAIVFEWGGMRFKSLSGQAGNSIANGSPPLWHFFQSNCVACRRNVVVRGPANSLLTLV